MNTVMDIARLMILTVWNSFAFLFAHWWGWLAWAVVVTCLAVALRRNLGLTIDGLRTAGSNALRLVRRKDRS